MEIQEPVRRKPRVDEEAEQEFEGEPRQVVEFKLAGDICAMDIDDIDSIVELSTVTRLPRTPDAIDGLMDLRGDTMAVVNPKQFLTVESGELDAEEQKVLVVDRNDDKQKIGVRVDEVLEVVTYYTSQIDEKKTLSDIDTDGVQGQIASGVIRKPVADGIDIVILLDVDAILDELT